MIKKVLKAISQQIIKKERDILLPSKYLKKFFDAVKKDDLCSDDKLKKIFENEEETILKYFESKVELSNRRFETEIENLKYQLYHDDLTNTYNKKYLTKYIVDKKGCFQREGTLVFIDLNKFKQINDNYGHIVGDNALEVFSSFLTTHLRKNDKVIRYAGDEFLILFDTSNEDKILEKMINLSIKLKNITVGTDTEHCINLEFSFGISAFAEGDSSKEVISKADKVMYLQKQQLKTLKNIKTA